MTWRVGVAAIVAAFCVMASVAAEPSIRYVPLDAPAGTSRAVVVDGVPLVHTRQLLPVDREGKIVGDRAVDKQIEQLLDNLDAVLRDAGSGLGKLVRVNVYAIAPETVESVQKQLAKRLDASVRPAFTAVLTALPHPKALVALDAVAAAEKQGEAVALKRCEGVAGEKECADFAVLPPGDVAYFSGYPDRGELAVSAVARSLSALLRQLEQLKLSPTHVVQVKVFLRPATAADETLREIKKFFPDQLTPPVVFVEWIAAAPVEIELIAALPSIDEPAPGVEYYNPPDVRPSPTFSRAALVRSPRRIYLSSLFARKPADALAEASDVFAQLKQVLAETGSDFRHLAKGTYYVSEDKPSEMFNRVRNEYFDPLRPPAASKIIVYGVGQAKRTLSVDMIAVPAEK